MKNQTPYNQPLQKGKVANIMSKRFVILGGGESGVGAALLAKKKGMMFFFPTKAL
jgi:heterodisulfide reductase subunit A-like polyferredoxin